MREQLPDRNIFLAIDGKFGKIFRDNLRQFMSRLRVLALEAGLDLSARENAHRNPFHRARGNERTAEIDNALVSPGSFPLESL